MQQKVIVTLIPYSRHVSAIHIHYQVSVAMLNRCTILHVAEDCANRSHKRIGINWFQ
jgi:hypothetical protein